MPIYPLQPLRRGNPHGGTRSPFVGGGVLDAPFCRASCAPVGRGAPPAARPCAALPAGHTGPALQKCTAVGRDPCVPPHTAPLAKTMSLRGRSAPVAIRIPRPLLHAKKEDASRHPLFYTIESLENYFSSTLAPTSSSSFFMFSASSLDRASFRVVGVSSTAFLASARPRPVISRTDLMTLIF